jgi:hypothetical protein
VESGNRRSNGKLTTEAWVGKADVEDTEGTEHSQGTRPVFNLCVFDPALSGNG